jgi:uncharacterized membrane protein YeaQ/YmgE (transglycosylase-associated protein family)
VDDGADDPGQITRGGGFGLFGNIVVGVIGALIGGWLFGLLGIAVGGLIGSIIAAVVGAIILLAVDPDSASARVTNTTLILQRLFQVGHSVGRAYGHITVGGPPPTRGSASAAHRYGQQWP